ncbi:MAG: Hsp20 family protein [Rhodospirillales bacterium]|nr:Hsp20 family protein [Rhodospirillales bacterium]
MNYDFAPLFRTAVGFDRLARLVETLPQEATHYPPYNIEKTGEDSYRVSLAVAGFAPENIELTVKDNALLVSGNLGEETRGEFLHRGIAARAFQRRFVLAEHMVVDGAELVNGLLNVNIRHVVPESAKPRRIEIAIPKAANQAISTPQLPHAA